MSDAFHNVLTSGTHQGVQGPDNVYASGGWKLYNQPVVINTTANTANIVSLVPANASCTLDGVYVVISNLSTETVTLKLSYDGTNFVDTYTPYDATTGKLATATLGNGTYWIPKNIGASAASLTKSAAIDRLFAAVFASYVPCV